MPQITNRINTTVAAATLTDIKTKLADINTVLPFLIGLTPDERKTLPRINEANKIFVEDAINAIKNNTEVLPAYIKLQDVTNDLELFNQLDELIQITNQLLQKLVDTQALAGSEAYVNSLVAYRLFEGASRAGLAGTQAIYDALKQRFAGQGATSGGDTPQQ